MAELSLQDENEKLKKSLEAAKKTDAKNQSCIAELKVRFQKLEKEHKSVKGAYKEQVSKDYEKKLANVRSAMKTKDAKIAQMLSSNVKMLETTKAQNKRIDALKIELGQAYLKLTPAQKAASNLKEMKKAYEETLFKCQGQQSEISQLNWNLETWKNNYESLQKSLITEKKTSRFCIKERDQLLERKETELRLACAEVKDLKATVKTLQTSLHLKLTECIAQKKKHEALVLDYFRKNQELKMEMEKLKKKEEEILKRTCEYCGL